MRILLKLVLRVLAKRVIDRYQPVVIGITGSVGKSTAKEAVFGILKGHFLVWKNNENFNNELGIPMTVLGIKPINDKNDVPGLMKDKFRLIFEVVKSFWLAYGLKQRYPKIMVLELAADRPGDVGYLVEIVKPKIGIVTAVGEIPVHVEYYASPQEVALEKSKLISALPPDGLAILNFDDQTVLDMKEKSKAPIITFSLTVGENNGGPDLWASEISYFASDNEQVIGGLSFKINRAIDSASVRVESIIGVHQVYGLLAAVAAGLHLGLKLPEITAGFEEIEFPPNRMTLRKGIKNSTVINDTYNASPLSTHAALDTLKDFGDALKKMNNWNGRRVAILGDMRELGKYQLEAHQVIGDLAGKRVDLLITVGIAAKFIADAAASQLLKENILSFPNSEEAKMKIKEILKENDLILIKGSRAIMMEKIIAEIVL